LSFEDHSVALPVAHIAPNENAATLHKTTASGPTAP
jgi:hypothetical protein